MADSSQASAIGFPGFSIFAPSTWIPTFGNWCGPGWSGGERTSGPLSDDQKAVAPIQLPDGSGVVRDSPVDVACKAHDLAYDAATGQPNEATLKLNADVTLENAIASMNWAALNGQEQTYASLMALAFNVKILTVDATGVGVESLKGESEAAFQRIQAQAGELNNATYTDAEGNRMSCTTNADGNLVFQCSQVGATETATLPAQALASGTIPDHIELTQSFDDGSSLSVVQQLDGNGVVRGEATLSIPATDEAGGLTTSTTKEFDDDGVLLRQTVIDTAQDGGQRTDVLTPTSGGGSVEEISHTSAAGQLLNRTITNTLADGSSTTTTFDASTGANGYDVADAEGNETDYITFYDGNGGYQQSWTASDGRSGENDRSDDGSTFTQVVNADGSSTTTTVDASTGANGYDVVDAAGNETDYTTFYDGDGGYQQSWTSNDGRSGENDRADDGSTFAQVVNADGSSTTTTFDASTGANGYDVVDAEDNETDYTTFYDDNGGYQQSWTTNDGHSGDNDRADDGSTFAQVVNADGSSTTTTFDTSTGANGYDVVDADGNETDYTTFYDGNGGYQQSWTASDGRSGENDRADDGSTFVQVANADGSSTTTTFDASTGANGYEVVDAAGNETDYITFYDENGGYQQSWASSDGRSGENDRFDDGGTFVEVVNADGSSTTTTVDASTGENGYEVVDAAGNETDYTTFYDGNGGYQQSWSASDGRSGENDRADNGSTFTQVVNADGSSTTTTFDTTSGANGYDVADAKGNETDYVTFYDGDGGYEQSWTSSDGRSGENDRSADGSTLTEVISADGSSTSQGFDAVTGERTEGFVNSDGTASGSVTETDGSHSTYTVDADGTRQTNSYDNTGTLDTIAYSFSDGSSELDLFNASGQHTSSTFDDGFGETTVESFSYDDSGRLILDSALSSNGDINQETYAYNSDGSFVNDGAFTSGDGTFESSHEKIASADGSYVDTLQDSLGDQGTANYDASTGQLVQVGQNFDGSGYNDVSGPNGYDDFSYGSDGSSLQLTFDAATGRSESVQQNANGSHSDAVSFSDGSFDVSSTTVDGSTVRERYDAATTETENQAQFANGSGFDNVSEADGSFNDYNFQANGSYTKDILDEATGYQELDERTGSGNGHYTGVDTIDTDIFSSTQGTTSVTNYSSNGGFSTTSTDKATDDHTTDLRSIKSDGSWDEVNTTLDSDGDELQKTVSSSDGAFQTTIPSLMPGGGEEVRGREVAHSDTSRTSPVVATTDYDEILDQTGVAKYSGSFDYSNWDPLIGSGSFQYDGATKHLTGSITESEDIGIPETINFDFTSGAQYHESFTSDHSDGTWDRIVNSDGSWSETSSDSLGDHSSVSVDAAGNFSGNIHYGASNTDAVVSSTGEFYANFAPLLEPEQLRVAGPFSPPLETIQAPPTNNI